MNKKHTLILLMALPLFAFAQLKNDGANIVVQAGATLFVEGNIENINAGTITNNGTIEVQGDLDNGATITSDAASLLVFSGSSTSNVTSGGAVFANVDINKDAGQNVVLQDAFGVSGVLDFIADNNKILCNNFAFQFSTTASHNGVDANDYIVTDGASGKVTRLGLADGNTFTYPVGADVSTFNPLIATGEAGHTADDISVQVLVDAKEDGLSGANFTEGVVNATWDVTEVNEGGSILGLTGIYTTSDELTGFDPMNCGLSHYTGGEWDLTVADLTSAVASGTYAGYSEVSRTGINGSLSPFVIGGSAVADYVTLSPIVNLSGAWNGTDMNDALRSLPSFPLTEPYSGLGYTQKGFGGSEEIAASVLTTTGNDAVVDWIFIEARDKADDTNILATKVAILQRDGDIVDVDNSSPVKIYGLDDDDYFVAIKHRNHLGVMTSTATSLDKMAPLLDFAGGTVITYGTNAQRDLGGGLNYGLWAGDADISGSVVYVGAGTDITPISSAVFLNPLNAGLFDPSLPVLDVYSSADLNLDGKIVYVGAGTDITLISSAVFLNPANAGLFDPSLVLIQQISN